MRNSYQSRKEWYKEYYQKLKRENRCPSHPDRKTKKGVVMCEECLNRKAKNTERLIKSGKCPSHPEVDAVKGKTICAKCLWASIIRHNNITYKMADKILEQQNHICPLSGRKLIKGINASLDHIQHKSNGGKTTIENIRFVDTQVNYARLDYTDEEFIQMCKDVAKNSGD